MHTMTKNFLNFWTIERPRTRPILALAGFFFELAGLGVFALGATLAYYLAKFYTSEGFVLFAALMAGFAILVGGIVFWLGLSAYNEARRGRQHIPHGVAVALLVAAILTQCMVLQIFATVSSGESATTKLSPAVIELIEKYRAA